MSWRFIWSDKPTERRLWRRGSSEIW